MLVALARVWDLGACAMAQPAEFANFEELETVVDASFAGTCSVQQLDAILRKCQPSLADPLRHLV